MPADYSGQNLRGRSFRGKNLEGANFSGADIRSANFSGAILVGANFSHAKAGLQRRWAIVLVLISWTLAIVLPMIAGYAGSFVLSIFNSPDTIKYRIGSWFGLITQVVVNIILVITHQRIKVTTILSIILAFTVVGTIAILSIEHEALTGNFVIARAFAIAFVGIFAGAFVGVFAVVGSGVFVSSTTIAGTGAGVFAGVLSVAGCIVGAIAEQSPPGTTAFPVIFSLAIVAVTFTIVNIHVAKQAIQGNKNYLYIRNIAIAFAAFRGTSFRNANLTDAIFTGATLKSTDFRKANLTRTCWQNAQKLDRVRPGTTYLQNALLRQVLVTGLGQKHIFDQQNLRGVNLRTANLQDASFIATDLSEANLQDGDLSRTRLVQTQLDQTDLTGAILTGAYIEEWNISTDTKLHGIRCDYVFMRLPPEKRPNFLALPPEERLDENPHRKPDDWNRNFVDDEFADFIAPLVQTLDLYHNKVTDPRFIAIAFQQLKEAHPEAELEIISIEKKGKNRDKINIKAETSPQADSSTLHADYFANLEYLQSLPPQAQQALLAERAAMIKMLAGLLGSSSTPHPDISIVNNNLQTQENENQNEPRNINIDDGNYNENIKGDYIQGDFSNI